ncbi:hypothetical protein TIFTF001_027550 [Ficus carica]|uniref:Uncharacterized protein n=1 Tax=Ficus carica TaxID=3494 RepID=A0AA88DND4_FICCA|nr:hypothetical protein TIFTF001_027550 [Ficus carica]
MHCFGVLKPYAAVGRVSVADIIGFNGSESISSKPEGGEAGEKIDANSRGVFGKGEGVGKLAAELVVVGGEEEEEEGVVGACGAVSGSSTASFRVAEAAEVEAADLGRLFWGEGREGNEEEEEEAREGKEGDSVEVEVPERKASHHRTRDRIGGQDGGGHFPTETTAWGGHGLSICADLEKIPPSDLRYHGGASREVVDAGKLASLARRLEVADRRL